jgi:hypothetical protein
MNSLGSILGPMLVAPLMGRLGGEGFFLFATVAMALGAAWALYRVAVIERPRHHEQRFVAVPRTSIVAVELAAGDGTSGQPPAGSAPQDQETATDR